MIELVIPGLARPEAKVQRFNKKRDGSRVPGARTDKPAQADWKARVAALARQAGVPMLVGPLHLYIEVRVVKPASWPKKPTASNPWPDVPHKRPDVDNYVKPIQDALTGIAWPDDSWITRVTAEKVFGAQAEVVVRYSEAACVAAMEAME